MLSDLPAWVWHGGSMGWGWDRLPTAGFHAEVAEVGAFCRTCASGAGKKQELRKREVGRL